MSVNFNTTLEPIVVGKAADYTIALSSTGGALAIADIQNVVVTFKADPNDADADKILQKVLGAGISITGVSGGIVSALMQLTNADTALFTAGKIYYFDVQVDTTSRGPELTAAGRVPIRQPITISN
ncbi:MAG: hypothetical protein KDK74_14545 [Cephaloticoccus sp.]|nr:hypothetical protein [Cephaloticoccus sp.]